MDNKKNVKSVRVPMGKIDVERLAALCAHNGEAQAVIIRRLIREAYEKVKRDN